MQERGFDGVDYNWEYPGYRFGKGYLSADEIRRDYDGLLALLRETREALGPAAVITMAYYPGVCIALGVHSAYCS